MKNFCTTPICSMGRKKGGYTSHEATFAIIVAIILVIVSILSILYRKYTENKLNGSTSNVSKQEEKEAEEADGPIPENGLTLWLDITDKSSLTFASDDNSNDVLIWESLANDIMLTADLETGIGRNPNRSSADSKYPLYHQAQNLDTYSIFFDYEHTARFNKKFEIQTIVSLHSFELNNGITHQQIHGYPYDGFANFYIFTSNKQCYFHGGASKKNGLFSNAALRSVKNGKIRMDGNEYDEDVKNVKQWEGGDVRIAILECTDIIKGINRIGADRKNHHFAGSIIELIVYNRKLSDEEKRDIQRYLINKYYLRYYLSLSVSITPIFNDDAITKQLLTYLIEPSILNVVQHENEQISF